MLQLRLACAIKRLGTFQMAMGSAAFSAEQWHHFRSVDLVREMMSCLAQGRIGTAIVIWERHNTEYDMGSHVVSVLSSIPDHVPSSLFVDWLRRGAGPAAPPAPHLCPRLDQPPRPQHGAHGEARMAEEWY